MKPATLDPVHPLYPGYIIYVILHPNQHLVRRATNIEFSFHFRRTNSCICTVVSVNPEVILYPMCGIVLDIAASDPFRKCILPRGFFVFRHCLNVMEIKNCHHGAVSNAHRCFNIFIRFTRQFIGASISYYTMSTQFAAGNHYRIIVLMGSVGVLLKS